MKRGNKYCLRLLMSLLVVLTLASCKNPDPYGLNRLEGRWRANVQGTEWIEMWDPVQTQPYAISGSGKEMRYGGEKLVEEMSIHMVDDKLVYTVKANGRNDENPVDFMLVQSDKETLRFENPSHDFPQYIEYKFLDVNRIIAKIGAQGTGSSSEEYVFDFTRME